MRRIGLCGLLVVCLMMVSSCSGFRLAEIAAEELPPEIREYITHRRGNADITWRACYQQDDYMVVWYEATVQPIGAPRYCYELFCWDGDVGQHRSGGDVERSSETLKHSWYGSRGEVAGAIFSTRANKAVGFLSDGGSVEAPVVNGFFVLRAERDDSPFEPQSFAPGADAVGVRFEKIEIRDDRDRTIRTYQRPS